MVVQPNESAWMQISNQRKSVKTLSEAVLKPPVDLQCDLCRNLLAEAVQAPCCQTKYCDECKFIVI